MCLWCKSFLTLVEGNTTAIFSLTDILVDSKAAKPLHCGTISRMA